MILETLGMILNDAAEYTSKKLIISVLFLVNKTKYKRITEMESIKQNSIILLGNDS